MPTLPAEFADLSPSPTGACHRGRGATTSASPAHHGPSSRRSTSAASCASRRRSTTSTPRHQRPPGRRHPPAAVTYSLMTVFVPRIEVWRQPQSRQRAGSDGLRPRPLALARSRHGAARRSPVLASPAPAQRARVTPEVRSTVRCGGVEAPSQARGHRRRPLGGGDVRQRQRGPDGRRVRREAGSTAMDPATAAARSRCTGRCASRRPCSRSATPWCSSPAAATSGTMLRHPETFSSVRRRRPAAAPTAR